MPGSSSVLFATSNRGKLAEARAILAPLGIAVEQFDGKGIEIQADTTAEVAAYSSRGAAAAAGRPVLVEDAGLYVDSLGGFPGPYSAYVFKTIGVAGVVSLLRPSAKREARFVSSLAYCKPGGEPTQFEGTALGSIALKPVGDRGFGFDPIFLPAGGSKTFGELTVEEKCVVSHRAASMKRFAKWYLSRDRR
jgi:XTP/dITP diphosphohydrolase